MITTKQIDMKPRLLTTLALLVFCSYGQAQIPEQASIDRIFAEWNKPDVPGGALGIVKDGKLIYAKGYGIADLEHDITITPSSVFYICSVSKHFVTFSVLLLEEQGKLNLDDKIQKYLPDFPEYEKPLTIRHFIHHTSGVRDNLTLMALKGRSYLDHIEDEEVYKLIKRQSTLNFTPGERYLYSNSCYFMLAMIVEKAAGQSLRDFARENMFEPLGMKNTQFYDDIPDLVKNRVFSYQKTEDGFDNLVSRFDLVGSGGVYSTIEDLLLWDRNFYHNKLGKGGPEIIEKMLEEGLLNNGESSGYAFGLKNGTYRGLKTVSHGGSLAGYRAHFLQFPGQSYSVIILSNRSDGAPGSKAYKVADIVLEELFTEEKEVKQAREEKPNSAPDEAAPAKVDVQEFTGDYYCEDLDVVYRFSVEGESLQFSIQNKEESALNISGVDEFRSSGLLFRFNRNKGKIAGFELDAGRVKNLAFTKINK